MALAQSQKSSHQKPPKETASAKVKSPKVMAFAKATQGHPKPPSVEMYHMGLWVRFQWASLWVAFSGKEPKGTERKGMLEAFETG